MEMKKGTDKKYKFIDLFAGIGGFHLALDDLGGECVFVSEWDEKARKTYTNNFKKKSPRLFKEELFAGDIKEVHEKDVPAHDILCAGFPCQPFSKGGYRRGFEDTRGTLFFDIARILKHHKPKYILLENVPNLVTHDNGNTYKTIIRTLNNLGYAVPKSPLILSPDDFGAPVLRKRVYIPGILKKEANVKEHLDLDFSAEIKKAPKEGIYKIVSAKRVPKKYYISDYEKKVLKLWDDFYKGIDINIIGFPVWADEFKKKYSTNHLPKWKQDFIKKNRELYKRNKKFIDKWLKENDDLSWVNNTHRKFEWQAGEACSSIYETLIQFRPSGVRAKRPDKFSTLVAMNHPQIVGKYKRRLTPDETKKLQAFPKNFVVHEEDNTALKQLGNAVNVDVVKAITKKLFDIA